VDKSNPLEEAINNDGIIGAGNPAYLISSRFNKKIAPLGETKRDMYLAQEKLVKVINNLLQDDHVNHEDRETIVLASRAITKGINFLEHIDAILKTLDEM